MHTHRPFLFITLAFIVGIFVESVTHLSAVLLIASFCTLFVLAIVLSRLKRIAGIIFLLAVSAFGAFDSYNGEVLPKDHLLLSVRKYYGKPAVVKGVVSSDIAVRALGRGQKTSFVVDIHEVCRWTYCSRKSGKIMMNLFEPIDVRYGDEIVASGKIHAPFDFGSRGRLSYRSYLAQKKIFLMLSVKKGTKLAVVSRNKGNLFKAASLRCRSKLNAIFDKYLSPAEAGLMQALITGERSEVPPHVREIFFRTGTVHILAISGMNLGMVAFGIFLFLNLFPMGRRWQMILTVVIIWLYSFMTGGNAPVLRAAVMSTVFLLGFILEREQDTINSLFFAAFCILIVSPSQIFDVGFQLSFGSVLAILLLTPLFMKPFEGKAFFKKRPLRWAAESLLVSLAAIVGIEGLLAYYFQVVTPVALIANLPVIPLVGIVTALGGGLLFFGFLFPPLAGLFAICIKVTLNLMVLILYGFSLIPLGCFYIPPVSMIQIVIYYVALFGFYAGACILIRNKAKISTAWQLGL